ncbi:proton-coupled zinc antiporter SLC30A2 isoform X2 [Drosophila gunungcola]|uniref:proton-coupled zinc antiporter SLC30A2 isoform X2 n=1 Tax=Drosophila gunungcola TaxID=103775 RepID=UPI0022E9755E|nr:proton-coupled zinc antiporter SLC30A2 isoform X2 [Drosophila gunungcola]
MPKYQKLDTSVPPHGYEDDCEEGVALYVDDNQTDPGLQQEPTNRAGRLPNVYGNKHSLNNNGVKSCVVATKTKTDQTPEEQTWEVPLLCSDDNAGMEHSDHERMEYGMELECRSRQPGFGANRRSKSAQEAKSKILLAVSLCCIFMIIEFLGGYVAGSLAIMTDAAHLASDCISFVIGLVAIWVGGRPPDERMSFGYKRFEVIGALASILGIWLLTSLLVVVAIQRIYSQDFELNVDMMMVISGIGIAINIVMVFVLHGSWFVGNGHGHCHGHSHRPSHDHSHTQSLTEAGSESFLMTEAAAPLETTDKLTNGHNIVITNGTQPFQQTGATYSQITHEEKNLNLRAAMIHVIGDLVQSVGVFLAAVLIKIYPSAKYADPLCTILFSIIVIITTVQLFRESLAILLNAVPLSLSLRTLHCELANLDGVRSVHHLNVWQHTTQQRVMMVHLVTDYRSDRNEILQAATKLVSGPRYNVWHSTIQLEQASA